MNTVTLAEMEEKLKGFHPGTYEFHFKSDVVNEDITGIEERLKAFGVKLTLVDSKIVKAVVS